MLRGVLIGGTVGLALVVASALAGCEEFTGTSSSTSSSGAESTSGSSGAGGTMSSSSTATGMTSSSTGITCVLQDGQPIDGTCGVFVKEGANGTGTPQSPFGSIIDALNVAIPAGVAVFVCTGTFDESVEVPQGTSLVGGVDCQNGWKYRATPSLADRSVLAPTASVVPLSVLQGASQTVAVVSGFTFHAADAAIASDSSVAVLVDNAPVRFEYCRFEAGAGHDGTDATMSALVPTPGGDGNNGSANTAVGCGSPGAPIPGGAAKTNPSCAATGGKGGTSGDGTGSNAIFGDSGSPHPPGGDGGFGSGCTGMNCVPCTDGLPGGSVNGGKGSAGVGLGSFGGSYVGVSGGPGMPGPAGGGGGGGGGARSTNGCGGDSGGSGGAGGCGGAGGPGGTFGGSSIAIAVRGTTNVTFVGCTASTKQAGRGGNGAPGVVGAPGGDGGVGGDHDGNVIAIATNACTGGKGGKGGDGGHGGGGSGGHSVGMLCALTSCPSATGLTVDPVMPSFAGAAGIGDGTNDGSAGQAIDTLAL